MTGGASSEPQAVSANSVTTIGIANPARLPLVVVPRVVMPCVVVLCVRRVVIVTMSGIKSRVAGMDRMVAAERDTFEIARRTADVFSLAERHVVGCFAFEDEIRRLFCR